MNRRDFLKFLGTTAVAIPFLKLRSEKEVEEVGEVVAEQSPWKNDMVVSQWEVYGGASATYVMPAFLDDLE